MAADIAAGQGGGIKGRWSRLSAVGPQESHFARGNAQAVLAGATIGMVVVGEGSRLRTLVAGGAGAGDAGQRVVLGVGARHIREGCPGREARMAGRAAGQGEGRPGLVAGAAERRRRRGTRPRHCVAGGTGSIEAGQGEGGMAGPQEGHRVWSGDITVAQGVVEAARGGSSRRRGGRVTGRVGSGTGEVALDAHRGVAGIHGGMGGSSRIAPGLDRVGGRHAVAVRAGPLAAG